MTLLNKNKIEDLKTSGAEDAVHLPSIYDL